MQEKKKNPDQGKVGEMGKPSLKSKFEEDMQKERDFVLNRAKQREKAEKAKTPSVNIKRVTDIIKKKGAAAKPGPKSIYTEIIDKEEKKGNSENPMIKALINRFKN